MYIHILLVYKRIQPGRVNRVHIGPTPLARLGRAPEATTGAHRQQRLPQGRHVDHEEPQVPLWQVLRLIELRRPSVDAIPVLPELFRGPHDDSLGLGP